MKHYQHARALKFYYTLAADDQSFDKLFLIDLILSKRKMDQKYASKMIRISY